MATSPEIDLPHLSELGSSDVEGPGIRDANNTHAAVGDLRRSSDDPASEIEGEEYSEKEQEKEQESSSKANRSNHNIGPESDIVWKYLTFETELPHPTAIHPSRPNQDAPPEPPNLSKYKNPFDWSDTR